MHDVTKLRPKRSMKRSGNASSHPDLHKSNDIVKHPKVNEAVEKYRDQLTPFEKSEIYSYNEVYCIGSYRVQGMKHITDKEGFYKVKVGEAIGYRYLVDAIVDSGAFG